MIFLHHLACDQYHSTYSHREPILLCQNCGAASDPKYHLG